MEARLPDLAALELEAASRLYPAAAVFVTLHPGSGGTESEELTRMVLRMYVKWAERAGFALETLDLESGSKDGVKKALLEVRGRGVHALLAGESGTHRFSRVSPFDRAGRRHTSFVAVDVVPVPTRSEMTFREEDVEVTAMRAGGPGGQHQNKVSTAIRIRHLPTGIEAVIRGRSQAQNIEAARQVLAAKLREREEVRERGQAAARRRDRGASTFGGSIRSYILSRSPLVRDHRTGYETRDTEGVLDGKLEELLSVGLQRQLADSSAPPPASAASAP